jgi:hypothetical protein
MELMLMTASAICTENSSLGPDGVSLFYRIRVLISQGCYSQALLYSHKVASILEKEMTTNTTV